MACHLYLCQGDLTSSVSRSLNAERGRAYRLRRLASGSSLPLEGGVALVANVYLRLRLFFSNIISASCGWFEVVGWR